MNTVVLEKNEQGIDVPVDIFAKMAKSRTLFLNGILDNNQATDIVATLLYLRSQKAKDPIVNIFLNCHCFDSRSILMVTDIILSLKDTPVRAVVVGEATGLAPLLLAVSAEAKAGPNACIELGPVVPHTIISKIDDIERYMNRIKFDENKIYSLYAKKLGKSIKEIQSLLQKELYLSSKEALKLGIIDSIVEEK